VFWEDAVHEQPAGAEITILSEPPEAGKVKLE
jgi:hypothetical protein